MTDAWYMTRNGQQYGPYGYEQFRQFAAEGRLSPTDMVMSGADQHWVSAGAVGGLFPRQQSVGLASAQFVTPPTIPPARAASVNCRDNVLTEWNRLRDVARWQRLLNIAIVPTSIAYILLPMIAVAVLGEAGGLLALFLVLLVVGFWVWLEVKLAISLRLNPWILGFLAIIPYVGMLVLVYLIVKTNRTLQTAGIKVGLFGATVPEQPPNVGCVIRSTTPSGTAMTAGSSEADVQSARRRVVGPAIGLIIVGVLACLLLLSIVTFATYTGLSEGEPDWFWFIPVMAFLAIPVVGSIVGAVKMLHLRSYSWALTAAVLALQPLLSGPWWLIGLPIGIWSLVVLSRADVKAAFRARSPAVGYSNHRRSD